MAEQSEEVELWLEHKTANNFASYFANGALLTGPVSQDLFQLTFFMDVARLKGERGKLTDEGSKLEKSYFVRGTPEDLEYFREDQVRITLTRRDLESIVKLINGRLEEAGRDYREPNRITNFIIKLTLVPPALPMTIA